MIKVGIIGFGLSATAFHIPFIQALPQYQLTAIVSCRTQQVYDSHPDVTVVSTAEALFDQNLDLIIITTPNELHFPQAQAALESGHHVVIEKPFVINSQQGQSLIELAKTKQKVLSIYHNRRFDSSFLTAQQLISQGTLGEIKQYQAHFDRFRPNARPERWREQAKPGTGTLFDLGSHLIDQALLLFGTPQRVLADLSCQADGAVVDDYAHLILAYANNLRVILHMGSLVSAQSPHLTVQGAKGSLVVQNLDPQEGLLRAGQKPYNTVWQQTMSQQTAQLNLATSGQAQAVPALHQESIGAVPGDYGRYYRQLAACLLKGKANPVSAESALEVIKLIEACEFSAREQRWVVI